MRIYFSVPIVPYVWSEAFMFDPAFEELQGKLRQIMEEATSLATGVKAWMLLSKEGLPIASAVPHEGVMKGRSLFYFLQKACC